MRPSRELGVAVLLMLGASGCAGVPQRTGLASTGSDGSIQASSSGWFGSRWWRPTPTETTRQGSEIAPEYQTAKKTSPETNIWPESRPGTRLSRLFTRFGRRDNASADPSGLTDSDSQARGLETTARPGTGRDDDRQVQPVAAIGNEGDPAPGGAARKPASGVASRDVPPLLASPIAVTVPEKPYDRPAFQGNVALSVARADLATGDALAGSNTLNGQLAASPGLVDPTADSAGSEFDQGRPKRESYLIPTAAGAADPQASRTEEPAQAAPGQTSPPAQSAPPPAIEPAQTAPAPRTRPAQPPAGSGRPGMTRPAAPAQQPAAPSARRTAPAPAPAQTPAARTPRATTPAPAAAPPVAVPAPVTEPAQSPVEPAPPPTSPPAPAPATPAQQPAPAATAQQSFPGAGVAPTALTLASPQAVGCGCDTATRPPRKPCWLKTWIHSLHHQPEPEPGPFASPQLPPPMFPTTYQMCKPAQKTVCPPAAATVQPTLQQTAQPAPTAQTKKCFSWIGKGPGTCLLKKIKKLGGGCRCHCHCCPAHAPRPACGGSCAIGNCETGAIAPSPQAGPASLQSPVSTSSLDPEPGDVAQGGKVLERIAAQGLDKAPQR
jgi:hypothetical protein